MSETEENTVYTVLYNYIDADYSIIKLFNSLQKAINYIQEQELDNCFKNGFYSVIINKDDDLYEKTKEDCLNICVFIDENGYLNNRFCNTDYISSFIIVKMKVH